MKLARVLGSVVLVCPFKVGRRFRISHCSPRSGGVRVAVGARAPTDDHPGLGERQDLLGWGGLPIQP